MLKWEKCLHAVALCCFCLFFSFHSFISVILRLEAAVSLGRRGTQHETDCFTLSQCSGLSRYQVTGVNQNNVANLPKKTKTKQNVVMMMTASSSEEKRQMVQKSKLQSANFMNSLDILEYKTKGNNSFQSNLLPDPESAEQNQTSFPQDP